MRCEDIMRRELAACTDQDTVQEAAKLMREKNVGFLPVRDATSGAVIGLLTDRDIAVRLCAEDRPASGTAVREVMTDEVYACLPGEGVKEAEDLMVRHKIARVVVIDEMGALQGVVHLTDIASRDWPWLAARTVGEVAERR